MLVCAAVSELGIAVITRQAVNFQSRPAGLILLAVASKLGLVESEASWL